MCYIGNTDIFYKSNNREDLNGEAPKRLLMAYVLPGKMQSLSKVDTAMLRSQVQ